MLNFFLHIRFYCLALPTPCCSFYRKMKSRLLTFGMFLFFLLTFVMGLLIFAKGFLLMRTALQLNSSCSVDFEARDDHSLAFGGCWMHARFKRAVIIIIDALKYDFLALDASYSGGNAGHKNKFKSVHSLLNSQPHNARLYKFMADPPTTTLQRLKGLTTGSLPTFVDAGSNFASPEISEDNIIDQLVRLNKKITFMGDDTWERLFPGRFHKSYPFPSFNVKDLHTVDNGILKILPSELEHKDWDVIIAHFLGVDHCGHRFGPNHPAMADKLAQMDQMIRNLTRLIADDTVLFVLGDHGMTGTGDHGGDSQDELTAGLFIYSPAKITSSPFPRQDVITQQTDFVPTLSLLLGIPIPFCSLGSLITDLFNYCPWWETNDNPVRQVFHTVKALHLTAHQVSRYVSEYAAISSDLPDSTLHSLRRLLKKADGELQVLMRTVTLGDVTEDVYSRFQHLQSQYQSYLRQVRQMCQDVWARFDLTLISIGILTMTIALLAMLGLLTLWREAVEDIPYFVYLAAGGLTLHLTYFTLHAALLPLTVLPLLSLALATTLLLYLAAVVTKRMVDIYRKTAWSTKHDDCVAVTLMCLCCSVYFSNSFVVYEDVIQHFLAQSVLWYMAYRTLVSFGAATDLHTDLNVKGPHVKFIKKNKQSSVTDLLETLTQPASVIFFVTCTCSALLRLSALFRSCREEQLGCEPSIFLAPLSTAVETIGYRNQRYFFTAGCLLAALWIIRKWMLHYGNLNGDRLNVLSMKFIIPLGGVCCALHWAVQALPHQQLDALPRWQQCLMAQLVYVCVVLHLAIVLVQPLFVFICYPRSASSVPVAASSKGIQDTVLLVYRHLRQSWSTRDDQETMPVAYGLGTAYSCSILALATGVFLLLELLLGDGMSPGLCLAVTVTFLFLELMSVSANCSQGGLQTPVSWLAILSHGVLSSTFFFATGHQTTIPSIRFESAFTGFHGDFSSNLVPAVLITLNTFAAPLLFSVLSPLLLFWKHLEGPLKKWLAVCETGKNSVLKWKGDFQLYDDGEMLRTNLGITCSKVLFFNTLKVLAAACAAAVHRRHLMVWKIFGPRFVFEMGSMLLTSLVLVFAYFFVLYVDHKISALARSLEKERSQ